MKIRHIAPLLTILLLASVLTACSPVSNLSGLQSKVNFTIRTPQYFPSDIAPDSLVVSGPEKDTMTQNIKVTLTYGDVKSGKYILIWEEGGETMFLAATGASVDYLHIEGNLVMQDQAEVTLPPKHIYYAWNYGGVNFQVRIYGYSIDECQKIIESMVLQNVFYNNK
jgi:hypothetical protein